MKSDDYIKLKTGVDINTKCSICGRTARQSYELGPINTGSKNFLYKYSYSFYESVDKKHLCPRCHKEKELEKLFEMMDKRGI